ncbi:MAG: SGNH/GDSL hydrolase family protein [Anaerolineales bacterium]|nr:SGNH/GDSL hydrolase family protein [Anaerolineales bacterium]
MHSLKQTFRTLIIFLLISGSIWAQDWAKTNYYRNSNALISSTDRSEPRVVFMGDSITESWQQLNPDYFTNIVYVNRGISGQTTPQMLVRFRADVIDLKPTAVIILAGTNDIAGNTGPITLDEILANIISMTELARIHNIEVILCSVLPVIAFPWKPDLQPAWEIAKLNQLILDYASSNNLFYLDYYSSMVDGRGGLQNRYTGDGVHPNAIGYHVMEALADRVILSVLP